MVKASMNITVQQIICSDRVWVWVCDNYLITETSVSPNTKNKSRTTLMGLKYHLIFPSSLRILYIKLLETPFVEYHKKFSSPTTLPTPKPSKVPLFSTSNLVRAFTWIT
jgi:hypothetical protein